MIASFKFQSVIIHGFGIALNPNQFLDPNHIRETLVEKKLTITMSETAVFIISAAYREVIARETWCSSNSVSAPFGNYRFYRSKSDF